jgi:hypothetical protein
VNIAKLPKFLRKPGEVTGLVHLRHASRTSRSLSKQTQRQGG